MPDDEPVSVPPVLATKADCEAVLAKHKYVIGRDHTADMPPARRAEIKAALNRLNVLAHLDADPRLPR